MVVCVVQKLLELDGIIKYEEAIKIPGLIVEFPFSIADIIVFSHKWCSRAHPDYPQKTKFKQLKNITYKKVFQICGVGLDGLFFVTP